MNIFLVLSCVFLYVNCHQVETYHPVVKTNNGHIMSLDRVRPGNVVQVHAIWNNYSSAMRIWNNYSSAMRILFNDTENEYDYYTFETDDNNILSVTGDHNVAIIMPNETKYHDLTYKFAQTIEVGEYLLNDKNTPSKIVSIFKHKKIGMITFSVFGPHNYFTGSSTNTNFFLVNSLTHISNPTYSTYYVFANVIVMFDMIRENLSTNNKYFFALGFTLATSII